MEELEPKVVVINRSAEAILGQEKVRQGQLKKDGSIK